MLLSTPIYAVQGECYKYNGYDINYLNCKCNCYAYKNNTKGWCSNCWHYRNIRNTKLTPSTSKHKHSTQDRIRIK